VEAENIVNNAMDPPLVPGVILGVARSSSMNIIPNQDRRSAVGDALYL